MVKTAAKEETVDEFSYNTIAWFTSANDYARNRRKRREATTMASQMARAEGIQDIIPRNTECSITVFPLRLRSLGMFRPNRAMMIGGMIPMEPEQDTKPELIALTAYFSAQEETGLEDLGGDYFS